jgi:dTMP kinase
MGPLPKRWFMFITLEGIEGVGKTTHLNFIVELLKKKKIPFIQTREPGGTEMGEEIRDILLKHRHELVASTTELLLMFAARAQHVTTIIKPALARGDWVLCDRFIDATYAYQGGGRGVPKHQIEILEKLVLGEFHPDLTFVFDAPPEIGLARAKGRSTHPDRFEREDLEFFERVRETYLSRATLLPNRYQIIDATQTLTDIQQQLENHLTRLWN